MATQTNELETLQAELKQLRSDIASIGNTVKDLASHSREAASAKAREGLDKTREYARDVGRRAEQEVEENPFTSMMVAFVVGLFAGLLFHRRS